MALNEPARSAVNLQKLEEAHIRAEHRLDRAERVLKLMISAGRRARRQRRDMREHMYEQDERITALVDAHVQTEELMRQRDAQLAQQWAEARSRTEELMRQHDARFSQQLAEARSQAEERNAQLTQQWAESRSQIDARLTELAEAQLRTEAAVGRLAEVVERLVTSRNGADGA